MRNQRASRVHYIHMFCVPSGCLTQDRPLLLLLQQIYWLYDPHIFFRTRDRVVAMVSPILLEYLIQICYWKRNSLTEKFASFISNNARLFFCHQIFYSLVPGKLKCSSLLPDQSSLLFSLKKKLKEVMYIQIYASDKNRHFLLKRFFYFILLLLITLSPYLFYSWQINLLFG